MSDDSLCILSIREAGRRFRDRTLSAVELTRAFLARIERLQPSLHAYITVTAERALDDARRADAELGSGMDRGPLHGIPIALKDIIATAGIRTTAHSRRLIDHVPARDATVARRLHEAGTVLLGKLATFEFAIGGPSDDLPFPRARNPWNPEVYTGGSSSGSGVAVAAAMAMAALGSDTGGSIRLPAAHCGVVGLKPSWGRVSKAGCTKLCDAFDHVGPLAWSVEDAALMLRAIAGRDRDDPDSSDRPVPDFAAGLDASGDLRGVRIGWLRHWYERDAQAAPEVCGAIAAAMDRLRGLGATVEEIELSPLDDYQACCLVLMLSETYALFEHDLRTRGGDFGRILRDRISMGAVFSAADYRHALHLRPRLIAETEQALTRHDALVTTAMFSAPVPVVQFPKHAMFKGRYITGPWNVTGHPAIALRCGFSAGGLPLGFQMAGRRWGEPALLRIAHRFERATPWVERRPAL